MLLIIAKFSNYLEQKKWTIRKWQPDRTPIFTQPELNSKQAEFRTFAKIFYLDEHTNTIFTL